MIQSLRLKLIGIMELWMGQWYRKKFLAEIQIIIIPFI